MSIMRSDHRRGTARPPVDGQRIAGPSHGDAPKQPTNSDARRVAGLDDWLALVARTAAADADAPIELLGSTSTSSLTPPFLVGGRSSGSWQSFGDLVGAQLSKASTPIRQSTCTSRRRGGSGRRYR
jgi:hypothetical protein